MYSSGLSLLRVRKDIRLSDTDTLHIHPEENINWRRHKNACPFYRERWFPNNDIAAGEPMYQVFCLKGTPPITQEEQDKCFKSKTCCWRLAEQAEKKRTKREKTEETPVASQ